MYNLPLSIIKNDDWTYTVLSNIFNIVTQWDNFEDALINGKDALACHIEWLEEWDMEYELLQNLSSWINTQVIV